MRILHLLSQRPELTGSGIYVRAMLRNAVGQGHENYLLAGISKDALPDLSDIQDTPVTFVTFNEKALPFDIAGMSDVMPYPSTRFKDLSAFQLKQYEAAFAEKIARIVQSFQPDIIHSHHLWFMSSIARELCHDRPVVVSSHGSDLRQFRACPHLQARVKDGCRKVNAVLALSHAHKMEITALYGVSQEKIWVVGAGYNEKVFYPGDKNHVPPVDIVYAGKLSKAKGVEYLLNAMGSLVDLPWNLHMIGKGTGHEGIEIEKIISKAGSRVIQYGNIKPEKLADLMRKSHIFVLPSLYEGFGLVLLEALACGCRIVVTQFPGVDEIFNWQDPAHVRFVPLPRLIHSDIPLDADTDRFKNDLAAAIRSMIEITITGTAMNLEKATDTLRRYSWSQVFSRVNACYCHVIH
jgi:glycosyltransferase involved in cell wall biosynthesis